MEPNKMKKFLLTPLILALTAFSSAADGLKNLSLSIEPIFGIKNGQIDEYVFQNNSFYSDDKLSELNWKIKNELYLGAKINAALRNFFAQARLSFALPAKSGEMLDSDWLNIQLSGQAGSLYKTNYSESDNHLDNDIDFGLKAGYDFLLKERLHIKPALAFDYTNTKFTASGGTGWYGNSKDGGGYYPYSDPEHQTIYSFSGDVIGYKREGYYFWLGSDFSVELPADISLTAGFFAAPYARLLSYDTHIQQNRKFADVTAGFFSAFRTNIGAEYEISKKHVVSLSAEYFYLKTIRGKSYIKNSGEKSYTQNSDTDGGAGAKYLDITLSYRIKIL